MAEPELNPDPSSTFTVMSDGFFRALETCPGEFREFVLKFADQPVKLSVVGAELADRIVRPFAHLVSDEAAGTATRLTVELWDRYATGIGIDEIPESDADYLEQSSASDRDRRVTVHRHRDSTLCFDPVGSRLIGGFSRAEDLSLYEMGRPLHAPLALWHNEQDVPIVHAGLVAGNGKGVLFAGPAGVGKSTCAVTCLMRGFSYLSDDLIGLQSEADGTFRGHSVYNSTYFERAHLARFPLLAPHAIESRYENEDKLLVLLSDVFPSRIERSTRIDAVVLPELGDETPSTFRPVSSGGALLALAPHSLKVNRNLGSRGFDKLARLAEGTPAYHLRLGSDLAGIPAAVEELLEEVG